jgi:hypothetical protein
MKINQTKQPMMRKFIIIVLGFFVFTCAHAQNKIKGIPRSPADTLNFSEAELINFVNSAYLVCAKIDPFDQVHVLKTLEIQSADANLKFASAYIESKTFFLGDIKLKMGGMMPVILISECVVINRNGTLVEYELNQEGRRLFDERLSNSPFDYQSDNYQ